MKFDIYGRFRLEIRRENETWVAYRAELGKRRKLNELVIPSDLPVEEIATYLDDFYHELAQPGRRIENLPSQRLSLTRGESSVTDGYGTAHPPQLGFPRFPGHFL